MSLKLASEATFRRIVDTILSTSKADDTSISFGDSEASTLRFANNLRHSIGRPRLAVAAEPGPIALDAPAMPQAVARVLATPIEGRTGEQSAALLAWYRTIDPEWQRLKAAEREHARGAPKPQVVTALISTEVPPMMSKVSPDCSSAL